VLASLDPWATLLATAAVAAVFWFRAGIITTLVASSIAGLALYLLGLIG
jgi:chromate transporter